jgi:hypothetical protein
VRARTALWVGFSMVVGPLAVLVAGIVAILALG